MAATAVATQGEEALAARNEAANVVSGPKEITLNVNGQDRKVTVEPRTSLLEVLRDQLALTGCKDLQDIYVDGADTVMIDGKATYAGTTFALQAEGKEVRTVEGLGTEENLDPLQESFIEYGAVQCGFCTPGMLISARALLDKNPHPTTEEIKVAISGNLCRCTGYVKIIQAIEIVAQEG